jgi:Flp pilus assembly pilin Flp
MKRRAVFAIIFLLVATTMWGYGQLVGDQSKSAFHDIVAAIYSLTALVALGFFALMLTIPLGDTPKEPAPPAKDDLPKVVAPPPPKIETSIPAATPATSRHWTKANEIGGESGT